MYFANLNVTFSIWFFFLLLLVEEGLVFLFATLGMSYGFFDDSDVQSVVGLLVGVVYMLAWLNKAGRFLCRRLPMLLGCTTPCACDFAVAACAWPLRWPC